MTAPSGALLEVEKHRNVFIEPASTGLPNLGPQEAVYASKIYEFNNSLGRTLQKQNLMKVFGTAAEEFQDSVSNLEIENEWCRNNLFGYRKLMIFGK